MNSLRWLRLFALCALAGSAAAAVDRYLGSAAFCGAPARAGCRALADQGPFSSLAPALPAFGLLGFSTVFWGSTVARVRVRRVACSFGVLGGLVGAVLLGSQVLYSPAVCRVCAVADVAAVGVAAASATALRNMPSAPSSWPMSAWLSLFVLAIGVPPVYALSRPDAAPSFVRAQWQPGKLNVVEISDFQCPHCRGLHRELAHALEPYADELNFVRLVYPLAGHPRAAWAARAYLCAEAQGRGEAAAHALYERDLSRVGSGSLATELGLDRAQLGRCIDNPATAQRVAETKRAVDAGGFEGLPTVYVGHEVLLGYRADEGAEPYMKALARLASGKRPPYRPLPWIALGALLMVLVTLSSRVVATRGRTRA